MQELIFNTKEQKATFRGFTFTYEKGSLYEPIDDDSLFLILSEQAIKFYWNDTIINDVTFASMSEFTTYLDSL